MKRGFMVAGAVFLLLVCRASAELHEFKLPDGRSIQAEIMSYNGKLDKVVLRLKNKSIKKVKPGLFVKEDQEYIKEWASLDGFRNKSFFKISCQKNLVEKWKKNIEGKVSYGGGGAQTETVGELKFEKYAYKLLLENRNTVPLENVEIEYCIFCKPKGKGRWVDSPDWFSEKIAGTISIDHLSAKSKKTVETNSAVIARQEILGDFVESYEKISAELEGIWVRITIKTPEGLTATRELFEPDTLQGKHAWPK